MAMPHSGSAAMFCQAYGRRASGGIVLTSTGWRLVPSPDSEQLVLYCHGKGALLGLAMGLANAAGQDEIKTNVLAPVATAHSDSPIGTRRKLLPERVAGVAVWLASPACELIGCLVKAAGARLAFSRLEDGHSVDPRGEGDRPRFAWAGLEELAAERM